jgi:transglutaminase-like putative cysteine protease
MLTFVLTAALLGGAVRVAPAADEAAARTEHWYVESQDGHKTGYRHVVWTPSSWKGRTTVHDTTTVVTRTVRNMAGWRDTFQSVSTSDLERGADGTLWWMRTRVEEPGRVELSEVIWTGAGYRYEEHIQGEEQNRETFVVPLEKPVYVDSESRLGARARAGLLKVGDHLDLVGLDLRARATHTTQLTVVAREPVPAEGGTPVRTWKIREFDPASKLTSFLWLDATGAFVQARVGTSRIQRATAEVARRPATKAAEFSITVHASPPLERIFDADRTRVRVFVRPDPDRDLPEFPVSPWSRLIEREDAGARGRVLTLELSRHDDPSAHATIPIAKPGFGRWLEATAQMQTHDALVQSTVRRVLGGETDARKAAAKLARFVYTTLTKRSLDVQQGDAVRILRECQGDCSEHCLLFVTLCRAAGIPARRCSGYVCIGSMWGSHAWAEIWTGAWIGADPTTGEVGTAARYLFFGYPDEPDSYPGVVSENAQGRMRIVTTRLAEGHASFRFGAGRPMQRVDRAHGRYLDVGTGLEAVGVPSGWKVRMSEDRFPFHVVGPDFSAIVRAMADQGEDLQTVGRYYEGASGSGTFAGRPALALRRGDTRYYVLHSRRRIVQIAINGGSDLERARLEKVLAPTFEEPAPAWKD